MNRMHIGLLALLVTGGAAAAQAPPRHDRLLDAPYITSTGATVARPGQPQSSGETPLDNKIQRQDNKIDRQICKGC